MLNSKVSCMTLRKLHPAICTQVAKYHPPRLPGVLKKRLRHVKLKNPETLQQKKKSFARFGAASGVEPGELFPPDQKIQEEITAEIEWWPTLQQMKLKVAQKEEERSAKAEIRSKKIAANMEKMPGWIEKYLHPQPKQKKISEDKNKDKEKEAIPSLNFLQPPSHPQVVQYMKEIKERDKQKDKS